MKTVYLLRHAKAGFDLSGQADAERILSHGGKQDATKLAYKLKGRNEVIELVYCSPALRTRQTLDVLHEVGGVVGADLQIVPMLYQATEDSVLTALQNTSAWVNSLMVIGHNPSMTQLTNLLAQEVRLDHLPTCGLVVIQFQTNDWVNITAGAGKVVWLDFPKNDYHIL